MTTGRSFALQPFPHPEYAPPPLTITGRADRAGQTLRLVYQLDGALAGVELAAPVPHPQRKDRLWQESCFEFFLAPTDSENYWEGNFSPAGHWNLYRFRCYREGMAEEGRVTEIPSQWHPTALSLGLTVKLDLSRLLKADQPFLLGISAILRTTSGTPSHWSLTHPADQPDFHHRSGFILFF